MESPSLTARGTPSKLHESPYTTPLFWAVREVALVAQSFARAALTINHILAMN